MASTPDLKVMDQELLSAGAITVMFILFVPYIHSIQRRETKPHSPLLLCVFFYMNSSFDGGMLFLVTVGVTRDSHLGCSGLLVTRCQTQLLAQNAHGRWLEENALLLLHTLDKLLQRSIRMVLKVLEDGRFDAFAEAPRRVPLKGKSLLNA